MRAGRLRHRVTIRDKQEIDDGHHGFDEQSIVVASRIPAEVMPLTGRALERAQQIDRRTTHQVALRHRPGIRQGQIVVFHDPDDGDRDLEVVTAPIDVDERRRELQLLCREALDVA